MSDDEQYDAEDIDGDIDDDEPEELDDADKPEEQKENDDEETEDADESDSELHEEDAETELQNYAATIESKPVMRKNIVVTDPAKRMTSNALTEYELTQLISIRATQIENHNSVLTNVDNLDNAVDMAVKELNDGKCPLVLRRKVGESTESNRITEYYEYWDVNTMTHPSGPLETRR